MVNRHQHYYVRGSGWVRELRSATEELVIKIADLLGLPNHEDSTSMLTRELDATMAGTPDGETDDAVAGALVLPCSAAGDDSETRRMRLTTKKIT